MKRSKKENNMSVGYQKKSCKTACTFDMGCGFYGIRTCILLYSAWRMGYGLSKLQA